LSFEDGTTLAEGLPGPLLDAGLAFLDVDDPVRRSFALAPRGAAKTTMAGALGIAVLMTQQPPVTTSLIAAAGERQAGHVVRAIEGLVHRAPALRSALDVQQSKVVHKGTGAMLETISSESSQTWGHTPVVSILDEFANWPPILRTYYETLASSWPKRPDSRALLLSTPSSPSHWTFPLWTSAVKSARWRAVQVEGPLPRISAAELAEQRAMLGDTAYTRLFLGRWTEGDDQLDPGAVERCVGHEGPLPWRPGVRYYVGADLSVTGGSRGDATALVVAHSEQRDGRTMVVVDRVHVWEPRPGREVPLAEVAAVCGELLAEYQATLRVDPYQAMSMVQTLRQRHPVEVVTFTAQSNSRRAMLLHRLVRDGGIDLPADPALTAELKALRLAETGTPGVYKWASDGSVRGHLDRLTALTLACEPLAQRDPGNWLHLAGLAECARCGQQIRETDPACAACGTVRDTASSLGGDSGGEDRDPVPNPWLNVYGPASQTPQQQLSALRGLSRFPSWAPGGRAA